MKIVLVKGFKGDKRILDVWLFFSGILTILNDKGLLGVVNLLQDTIKRRKLILTLTVIEEKYLNNFYAGDYKMFEVIYIKFSSNSHPPSYFLPFWT